MPGIYVLYPCIYYVYPMSWIYMVYTWYIQNDVYIWYIRGISVDIPSFLFLDFSAGPCCWSHSMRTRVLVIKIGLFHAPPLQLCLGIRRPTKGSLLLSPRRGRCWRLALRGAAGSLRGGRLGGLVLITICPDASSSPPPSPPLSPPPSARRLRRLRRRRLRRRGLLSWRCRVR